MNILAIDGALGTFACAVLSDGKIIYRTIESNVALEAGLALVAGALADAQLSSGDIQRLAIGTGPGTFTGLRIAVSYAKALALGWERPLCAIGSFDALEYGLTASKRAAVICARPGVCSARIVIGDAQERLSGRTAEVCDAIARAAAQAPITVSGAPEDVRAALGERGILVHTYVSPEPPAAAIARLAAVRPCAKSLHEVRADYGELPAARVPDFR